MVEVETDEVECILRACGYSSSTCGYCGDAPGQRSRTRSSKTYGADAVQLTCAVYQSLCDSGWRRSGTYCYLPDNSTTCCPHLTIRCLADRFRANKSQRQLLNRFVRHVKEVAQAQTGVKPLAAGSSTVRVQGSPTGSKGKGKNNAAYNLIDVFGDIEGPDSPLVIRTEPASFTKEKYRLFRTYQEQVHNDTHVSESGFIRFLCQSPLVMHKAGTGIEYGSFHQLYYLGVYFIWKPELANLSLGRVGALREIALVQQLSRRQPDMKYYYLGYYIHSCPKMRYKAEYQPAELADWVTRSFHAFEKCQPLLDADSRASFAPHSVATLRQDAPTPSARGEASMEEDTSSDNGSDDEEGQFPVPSPPGWLDPEHLPTSVLAQAKILVGGPRELLSILRQTPVDREFLDPFRLSLSQLPAKILTSDALAPMRQCLAALGEHLASSITLLLL